MSMNIPRTLSEIAPATFQLVPQCFSQLFHAVPLFRYRRNLNSSLNIHICNQLFHTIIVDILSDPTCKWHYGPGVFKSLSDQGLDLSGVLLDCDTVPGRWVPVFRENVLPHIQVLFVTLFMVNIKFLYHVTGKSRWTISGPIRFTLHTPFLWDAFDYIPHAFSYKFKAVCLSFRFSEYIFYALPISPCLVAYLILLSLKGANCCSDVSVLQFGQRSLELLVETPAIVTEVLVVYHSPFNLR
jgi:hypothetical protein